MALWRSLPIASCADSQRPASKCCADMLIVSAWCRLPRCKAKSRQSEFQSAKREEPAGRKHRWCLVCGHCGCWAYVIHSMMNRSHRTTDSDKTSILARRHLRSRHEKYIFAAGNLRLSRRRSPQSADAATREAGGRSCERLCGNIGHAHRLRPALQVMDPGWSNLGSVKEGGTRTKSKSGASLGSGRCGDRHHTSRHRRRRDCRHLTAWRRATPTPTLG